MPSVRVRRSNYSQLSDLSSSPLNPDSPRRDTLASTPQRPALDSGTSRIYSSVRRQSDALRPPPRDIFSSPVRHRGRASTFTAGTTPRSLGALAPIHRTSAGDTIFQGASADVAIPDIGERLMRVGSAISFSHSAHSARDEDSDSDEDDPDKVREDHHDEDIVEHLEVIDPQVATVSNLANAANAILIPPLSFYSRKPVVVLPRIERDVEALAGDSSDELDRHVEDVLRKRDKFRRIMRGVWSFLKTPIGICVGIYGFLVVFWGAAIVVFLIRMINFHNRYTQDFWVEISSQIENGLFCVTGIGLLPWRIVDTYRIIKIWYYKYRTRKLRRLSGIPELYDEDDLPDPIYDENYVHVLSEKQQADLHYQQQKFMKSQTWYRPHGTETHRAFPINTALLIICLNDGNSLFQMGLAGCQWGLDRFQRPVWTTAILIPGAFLCGIASGVYIWRGSQKTKRTEQVERYLRDALRMDDGTPPKEGDAASGSSGNGLLDASLSRLTEQEKQQQQLQALKNGNALVEKDTPTPSPAHTPKPRMLRRPSSQAPGIVIEEEMTIPAR
ncbi:hypothetical protein DENSPDRAFT_831143 [Dentipellis sp. KUC8613]|nr:hypothetical protein DENSPDRAFT_831143 [Dentipellis sp. KUC8613]